MKIRNSKLIIFAILANILAMSIALPANAAPNQKQFCEKLIDNAARMQERVDKKNEKIENFRENQDSQIAKKRTARDVQLAQMRQKWDEQREKQLLKISQNADTPQQKQALEKFKSAILKAIGEKKEALNKANEAFRKGIDDALKERRTAIDKIFQSYKDAVKTALEKAKTDCSAQKDAKIIKKDLSEALSQAWQKFIQDRNAVDKTQVKIESLKSGHKKAIQEAQDSFKNALKSAQQELKDSLKPATSTTSIP